MFIDAPDGRGCWFCEVGVLVEYVHSRAGKVALCLDCVMRWFPGRSVEWWEARHAPLRDHLGDRLRAAFQRQQQEALAHRWRLEHPEMVGARK